MPPRGGLGAALPPSPSFRTPVSQPADGVVTPTSGDPLLNIPTQSSSMVAAASGPTSYEDASNSFESSDGEGNSTAAPTRAPRAFPLPPMPLHTLDAARDLRLAKLEGITGEEMAALNAAKAQHHSVQLFHGGNLSPPIEIPITSYELERLEAMQWLVDSIINLYTQGLVRDRYLLRNTELAAETGTDQLPRHCFFNSCFSPSSSTTAMGTRSTPKPLSGTTLPA